MNLPVYDGNSGNIATATQFAYVPSMPVKALNYFNKGCLMLQCLCMPVVASAMVINWQFLAKNKS
jgi:hypothetical protein